MSAVPLRAAAQALGVSAGTLIRWKRDGCPTVRRGGRGRGRAALFDVGEVRAWRQRAPAPGADLGPLVARLPDILGAAVAEAFRLTPTKRDPAALAWLAACGWQLALGAVDDALGDAGVEVPQRADIPDAVLRLRKIANGNERF